MVKAGDGVLRLPAQSFELGGVLVERANTVSRRASGARGRAQAHSHAQARDRARGRRADAAPRISRRVLGRGVAARLRACRLSQPSSRHGDDRGRRDLRRGGARGDFPALGQAQGMDRRRARVPGLAQRPGGGPPRLGETADRDKNDALLMGFALTQAQRLARRRSGDIPEADRTFIVESRRAARRRNAGCRRSSASWLRRWPRAWPPGGSRIG